MSTSSHEPIAIIGAGISGLSAGITLVKNGIKSVIFERDKTLSSEGSGTTLSKNALDVLEALSLLEEIKKESFQANKISIKSKSKLITELNPYIFYTTRQKIVEILKKNYLRLGGEILFNHEMIDFNNDLKEIIFKSNSSFKTSHVLACDGINSRIRKLFFSKDKPIYSGFNAWRGFIDDTKNKVPEMHYGSGSHFVTYPINDLMERCFIGIVRSKNILDESWIKKGTVEEVLNDFNNYDESIISLIKESKNLHKWGIYTRPSLKKMYIKNITLLGDAAHPMVPFLGQGGCLAIEDGYTFGTLLKKSELNFSKTQFFYDKLRRTRAKIIQNLSMKVAFSNHLSNPILENSRNFIMKYSGLPQYAQKKLHSFNVDESINKILK